MNARRDFLRQLVPAGALGAVALNTDWLERIVSAGAAVADRTAAEVAADEGYWRDIQQAFTLDRTIINLNNGYTCPSPRVVHEALKRYLDSSNQAPIHFMWNTLEPNVEQVRRKLAVEVGCDMEELAITRNASEGLQIVQLGIDLQPGDHVVTTNQDYGRMLDTWDQRVRRDKIAVTKIAFPVPTTNLSELTDRITQAITPKTKVIHICHITNLTGQLFPVRDIARHGAGARHPDDRRRRARLRALPVQGLAISSATTTAARCTSGCSRRSAPASSTCAARTSPRCGR